MPIAGTTVGPVSPELRDRLAAYRDAEGHPHYHATIEALLAEQQLSENEPGYKSL